MNKGRLIRIAIAGVLLTVGGLAFLPQIFVLTGTESVVSGRVLVLRPEIDGRVTGPLPAPGTVLPAGATVAEIVGRVPDERAVRRLEGEIEAIGRRLDNIAQTRSTLEATRAALEARAAAFAAHERLETAAELAGAEAALTAARAEADLARQEAERRGRLAANGHASTADLEAARRTVRVAEAAVDARAAERDAVRARLAAVDDGFSSDQGQNDVAYSRQRVDEIDLRLADLAAEAGDLEARRGQASQELEAERSWLARSSGERLTAPTRSVVWRLPVASGSDVTVGEPVARLLDCSDLFLEVHIDERDAVAARPGGEVDVVLTGGGPTVTGHVATVRGGAAAFENGSLAATVGERHTRRTVEVVVQLDAAALAAEETAFCHVGRSATVQFEGLTGRGARTLQALFDGLGGGALAAALSHRIGLRPAGDSP